MFIFTTQFHSVNHYIHLANAYWYRLAALVDRYLTISQVRISVLFVEPLSDSTKALLSKKKSKESANSDSADPVEIILTFKRYVYDPNKAMRQS